MHVSKRATTVPTVTAISSTISSTIAAAVAAAVAATIAATITTIAVSEAASTRDKVLKAAGVTVEDEHRAIARGWTAVHAAHCLARRCRQEC